jgi:hypothetical protein
MAVRKRCRSSGCKTNPRCDHAWWLDVMHHGKRYRMPLDDFAFPRGATAPITSKQEAEKVWEPKFIAEIASAKILGRRCNVKARPASRQPLLICSRCIGSARRR